MATIISSPQDTITKFGVSMQVLILESELLMGAGLKNLLAGHVNLTLSGISPNSPVELLAYIHQYQPDVIILDTISSLMNPGQLLAALDAYPKFLRLLEVSANDNQVCVYDKRQIRLSESRNLLELVTGG